MTKTAKKTYPWGGVSPGGPTLPRSNAQLLRSQNVNITYNIHYKNTCAIYGFVYKSFISLLGSPPRFSPLLTKRSPVR